MIRRIILICALIALSSCSSDDSGNPKVLKTKMVINEWVDGQNQHIPNLKIYINGADQTFPPGVIQFRTVKDGDEIKLISPYVEGKIYRVEVLTSDDFSVSSHVIYDVTTNPIDGTFTIDL